MADFINKLDFYSLNEEQQQIADAIGLDNLKKLIRAFGGTSLYIPKSDSLTKEYRNQQIKQKYDGKNISQLAAIYNLSVARIRTIVLEK